MRRSDIPLWIAAALVAGVFFVCAGGGGSEWAGANPADLYYNALVRGFQSGHLSLAKDVPPGLAALPDPYDPAANAPYRAAPFFLQDTSYFQGRLYLYFGITPALVLFWPWALLTGQYLAHKYAVAIFCSVGFAASAWILRQIWRRYFPEAHAAVAAACVLALGLAASMPLMLQRPGICEVPIGCAYAFLMLSLAFLWRALHRPPGLAWLAAASLAFGLAVGARPSDLFAGAVVLVPVFLAGRRFSRRALAAAILPPAACGLGLLLYNYARFGSPEDFGHAYQLGDIEHAPGFGLGYLGYNLRLYFLAPAYWTGVFPFAQGIRVPPAPPGTYTPDAIFGILPNIPLVLFALAAPMGLTDRSSDDRTRLRAFLFAVAGLAALVLGPLLLYFAACGRYEAEFLPPLVLLAAVGILALERSESGRARIAWRAAWIALLVFSVAFNLLASVGRYAGQRYAEGLALERAGRLPEAIGKFEATVAVSPEFASAHNSLGIALANTHRFPEATVQFEAAVRLRPDYADARANLGNIYLLTGRTQEAIDQYEAVLRLNPSDDQVRARLDLAQRRLLNPR